MNFPRSSPVSRDRISPVIAALLLLLAQPALAAMSLDKIIVYLTDQPNSRDDIVVSNPDAENLYLQTEIYRVDNPGQPDEKRVRVVDPKEFKLLVNPARAVLAPGEQKRFRLMSLERDLETEKVYRVTFKPVVGDVKTDRTALKILVAYQALVFVQPPEGRYRLGLSRAGDQWQLQNTGSVNVEVAEIQHCRDEGSCTDLGLSGRIYAGAGLVVPQELEGGYLSVVARSGENSSTEKLPVR
ncbi:fimbria/pilus periplasmic chaperone [Microbulbifer yueqingensis]|uniref:Pili and flagellar-assembly chaperone, PapD N-terminal domain n=1 Tax=Microbulbifer yueqingensis TaxID=658219 RepID=A0A1G8VML2_9GAMM|nr:fimbria/pilus periplasmic chaperone [Microbulbifer yueqingensis]SDJ67298.1 Pili and flagellar-assembly chaperone, PapD N-terminal domain [Microbulbifer yueqingensis]